MGLKELRQVLRVAPASYRIVGAIGVALIAYTAISERSVSWTTSEPFTQSHARGIAKYTLAIACMLLPFLGAFARLPAGAEKVASWLRRTTFP